MADPAVVQSASAQAPAAQEETDCAEGPTEAKDGARARRASSLNRTSMRTVSAVLLAREVSSSITSGASSKSQAQLLFERLDVDGDKRVRQTQLRRLPRLLVGTQIAGSVVVALTVQRLVGLPTRRTQIKLSELYALIQALLCKELDSSPEAAEAAMSLLSTDVSEELLNSGLDLDSFTEVHERLCSLSFLSRLLHEYDLLSLLTVQSFMRHGGLVDDTGVINLRRFINVYSLLVAAPFLLPVYFTRTEDAFVCVQVLLADKAQLWFGIAHARQRFFPPARSLVTLRWPIFVMWAIIVAWAIAAFLPIAVWWPVEGAPLVRAEGTIKVNDPAFPSFEESHVQAVCMHIVLLTWAAKCAVQSDAKIQALADFMTHNRLESQRLSPAPGDGGMTLRDMIVRMETITQHAMEDARLWPILRVFSISASVVMAIAWRCIRLALSMPAFSNAIWVGPLVSACWVYAHMHTATVIAFEGSEVYAQLFQASLRTRLFSCLWSSQAAEVVDLPPLPTSHPHSLQLWSLLRSFTQSRSPLTMRWLECVISIIVLDVGLVTALTFVALFKGGNVALTLDTQTLVLWAFCVFLAMSAFVTLVVFLAVSIGELYRNDLPRLRRQMLETEVSLLAAPPDNTGERGAWQESIHCQRILERLVACLENENEYLQIFGYPLDNGVKNTIISFAVANVASTATIVIMSALTRSAL